MRSGSALLFVLLLSSLQLSSGATGALDNQSKECCFELSQMKLPVKRIVSYRHTTSNCPSSAVIFKMVSGRLYCVDPKMDWVKDRMKVMDHRKTASSKEKPTTP